MKKCQSTDREKEIIVRNKNICNSDILYCNRKNFLAMSTVHMQVTYVLVMFQGKWEVCRFIQLPLNFSLATEILKVVHRLLMRW